MMAELVICFCICLVVFLGSIARFSKGVDFTDSEKFNVEMICPDEVAKVREFKRRWNI